MPDPSQVPVIVLNWNGWDDTIRCVESVYSADPSALVWVVDNGSREDHSTELLRNFPELRYLQLEDNYGWAGGYNRALEVADNESFEFCFLLNNDTTVQDDFLRNAVSQLRDDIASVGSQILFSDGMSVRFDGKYHEPGEVHFASKSHEPIESDRVNGAGMLVRMSAFREVGSFDERFFCYREETDWSLRAKLAGWRLIVAPASIVYHACEGSDISHNSLYYRVRNAYIETDVFHPDVSRLNQEYELKARYLWSSGDRKAAKSVLSAMSDGSHGRFGPRTSRSPGIGTLISYCWRHDVRPKLRYPARLASRFVSQSPES